MVDLAIAGARVVPIAADPIENGTVLIADGKIAAVGAGLAVPASASVIDAAGSWLLPPSPQVLASASDYAARPGSCRKPRRARFEELQHLLVLPGTGRPIRRMSRPPLGQ